METDHYREELSPFYRYSLGIVLAVISIGLKSILLPSGSGATYTAFYPFVILTFYLCGNGPGVITITLTAAFVIIDSGTFNLFSPTFRTSEQTLLYIIAAGSCGYIVSRMNALRLTLFEAQKKLAREKLDEAENSLSLAVEGARLGTWQYNPHNSVVSFSDRFAEHFGLPIGVHAVSYDKILDIIHSDDRGTVDDALRRAITSSVDFIVEHRVVWPDGSVHWIYGHGRPLYAEDGSLKQLDGVTTDVTDRKVSEFNYRSSVATIIATFNSMNEAVVVGDLHGNVVATNHAAASFFRFKRPEEIPRTFSEFSEIFEISGIDDGPIEHPYVLALQGVKRTYELKVRRKDTGDAWYALAGTSPILDDRGQIIGTSSTGLDITDRVESHLRLEENVKKRTSELAAANEILAKISRHDALTGLHNRMACDERLKAEFQRMKRTRETYSILMIDIDLFKAVNDSCGHAVGDSVLKLVAQTLSNNLRECDFIARWGGEEFLVLLPATEFDHACFVAEKLRSAVASKSEPLAGTVTISIGVAAASPDHLDAELAVMKADEGLYVAKQGGRNRVVGKIPSAELE